MTSVRTSLNFQSVTIKMTALHGCDIKITFLILGTFLYLYIQLRAKVDAILKKNEPVPDEDAPEDPASTRFWCWTATKCTDREKLSVKGTSTTAIKPSAGGVAALLDGSGMPSLTPTTTTPSTVSLQSLVTVASTAAEAPGGGGTNPKAKGKAKAKAKVKREDPKTTKEKKDTARN